MNEIICMVIMAFVCLIGIPLVYFIMEVLPKFAQEVAKTIRWNFERWRDRQN